MRISRLLAMAAVVVGGLWLAACSRQSTSAASDERTGSVNVVVETSMGSFTVELWPDKAPETVKNFLNYVDKGFFAGTIFHRVIPNFMIQGGGFTDDMKQKTTDKPVKNEARKDVPNERGTIAMARTSDVNSATAQFFINVKDNGGLDHKDNTAAGYGYAVFGKVTKGMDVVQAIGELGDPASGGTGAPLQSVAIEKAKVRER